MINSAVAQALYATQLETLTGFRQFLVNKDDEEVDLEFIDELINGFKATLEVQKLAEPKGAKGAKGKGGKGAKKGGSDGEGADAKPKVKRPPSAYTMFIQYQIEVAKAANPDGKAGKNLMADAAVKWGTLSDETKEELKTALKANPDLTPAELITQVIG